MLFFMTHRHLRLGFSAMACLAEWQQYNASHMQPPESAIDSLVPRMHRILMADSLWLRLSIR